METPSTNVKNAAKSKNNNAALIKVQLNEYEMAALTNSQEWDKSMGQTPINKGRKQKFLQMKCNKGIAKQYQVRLARNELMLLAAFWSQVLFGTSEPQLAKERLKYLKGYLGTSVVNAIKNRVGDHEFEKQEKENEVEPDEDEYEEQDFDTYRGR
jgi:hypothetical protein